MPRNLYEMTHENGSCTFIRADSVGQARRMYVQMGFPLSDVVRIAKVENDEVEGDEK